MPDDPNSPFMPRDWYVARIQKLEQLVRKHRDQFDFYATNHAEKAVRLELQAAPVPSDLIHETRVKASVNRALVEEADKVLGDAAGGLDKFPTDVFRLIEGWANDRQLIAPEKSARQTLKLFEEGGEVAGAIARLDKAKLMDGIGDCVVVLTILAAQQGTSIEECILMAWMEIKDRKGKTVDGVFIKAEDIPVAPPTLAELGLQGS